MNYLRERFIQFGIIGIILGLLIGILIPIFIGGGGSNKSIGDRLILTGTSQTPSLNIPISTIDASANGWIDPMLCAPGRGRYFTKEDSANLVVLYNNAETVSGVYLRSDTEMPAPWKKTDALKGGGGMEIIGQEHWGLYAFFNDPIQACQRPDAGTVGTGGTGYSGGHAVRDYQPTPTPTPIPNAGETIAKISEGLSSDTKMFKVVNTTDESDVATNITSSQVAKLLSSLTDTREGTGKWIDNISHRGLTGNTASIADILPSAKSDKLSVSLWINENNDLNLIEINGSITYEGSGFTNLNISPE